LAVGDAEFQKKCLGKMKDVSVNDGRTVLFVSHNMAAVSELCPLTLSMHQGTLNEFGFSGEVISNYLQSNVKAEDTNVISDIYLTKLTVTNFFFTQDINPSIKFFQGKPIKFSFQVINEHFYDVDLEFNIEIKTLEGIPVTCFGNEFQRLPIKCFRGSNNITAELKENLLRKGVYLISVYIKFFHEKLDMQNVYNEDILKIEVEPQINEEFGIELPWKQFPLGFQHGNLATKIDKITVIHD
jgi:lipopolysaccharide transport system ATP-binding protein